MSIKITGLVWDFFPYGGNQLLVMLRLADWANDDGELMGGKAVDIIARSCKVDRRTIQRTIRKLEAEQWLKRNASTFAPNQYVLNVGKLSQQTLIDDKKPQEKGAAICHGRQTDTGDTSATLKRNIYIPPIVPQCIPKDVLQDFLVYRKQKKKPLTEKGCELLLVKLEKLAAEGQDVRACLEQSMENSWTGVFPVKQDTTHTPGGNNGTSGRTSGAGRRQGGSQSAADRVRGANNRSAPAGA